MARAKKIIRKSEREALKERRRSGEFKQDKKDARAAGLSRGEARKRAKRLSRVQALANRKGMRADMAAKREEDASVNKMFGDRRRMEAKRGGQKLAYDVAKPLSPAEQRENAPGGTPTKRLNGKENVSFDDKKGMYKITGADGYVRYSKSKPAMYGAKVKAVKKAKSGAALKSVPSKAKGLSKLPKGVRNKMGYMQEGGKVKSKSVGVLKSDTNKDGPKMEPGKKPYTKNGINYTWDRKNSVWRGDADKGLNVKKAKKGASVGSPYEAAMAKWEKAMDAWRVTKKEAISKGQLIPGPPTKPVKPPKASAPDISSKSDNTKTPNVRVNKKILSSFTANMKKWEKDMAAWKKADRNGEFDGKLIPAKPTKPVK